MPDALGTVDAGVSRRRAFRLWTGVTPPTDYMFETACRFFTERA
jgi:hypothetical protein